MKTAIYADDLPDPDKAIHVSIHYQTLGGNEGAWSRWVQADSMEEALDWASDHVRKFKRVLKVFAGDASPRRCR